MAEEVLNKQQKEAVTFGRGPLLIIAGAGTGKTKVITERIKHLILNKKVKPENILALTFTEKAAEEMQERVDVALPYGYADMWIHTFHAFCDRILKENAHYLGFDNGYKLLSQSESLYFLQTHIFDLGLKKFKPLGKPTKFLEALASHFSRLSDEDITPSEYITWVKKQEHLEEKDMYLELAQAYKAYENLKIQESVMDFSDLISYTLKLFRTNKQLLKKYQNYFSYIFVDEFQDTNFAQNELAILLAGEKQNITVVADDDQSIYRFRGAAVSNVMQFTKNFLKTKIISLTENYRSSQIILDSAYSLIQHNNPNRLEVIKSISKKLHANGVHMNRPVELIHTDTAKEEAEKIVEKIEVFTKGTYEYRDIAVLVRANSHAREIISELQRKKIPYRFLGPEFLFHQEEIKDLIAYASFLVNSNDSVSLYRILTMSNFNIPILEIHKILSHAKRDNKSLFEEIHDGTLTYVDKATAEKIKIFNTMSKNHLELSRRSSAWNVLYNFLKDSGIMLSLNQINSLEDEKRVKNITSFFNRIKHFEQGRMNPTIVSFVDWISLMLTLGDSPVLSEEDLSVDNAVSILTVHRSKGLEFPVVIMANLVSERFPTRDRLEKIPLPEAILKENLSTGEDFHLEEERRLFYVGITRAKEYLFFTASNLYGEAKRVKKLSPFIFEAIPNVKDTLLHKEHIAPLTLSESLSSFEEEKKPNVPPSKFHVDYITYSNLQLFDICNLHYKAKVILNIPTPPNAYQSYGISIHKTLQQFYQSLMNGGKPTKQDMTKILKDMWIHEGYENKKDEKDSFEDARKMLDTFYNSRYKPDQKPIALEKQFNFTLKNGVKASGIIDRIDKTKEGIEIIDYKTGENNPKASKAHEEQLALYALAATRIKDPLFDKKPEDIKLTIYFLKDNSEKSIKLSGKDLENYEDKLVKTIQEIESSDFTCTNKILCKTCEYRVLCQAYI